MEVDNGSHRVEEDIQFDEAKVCPHMLSSVLEEILFILSTLTHSCLKFQINQLKELSRQPDIYDRLTKSLAPNIWELDDVKRGLLCQVLV